MRNQSLNNCSPRRSNHASGRACHFSPTQNSGVSSAVLRLYSAAYQAVPVIMSEQSSSVLLPAGQVPQCTSVHWMPFGINFDGPAAPGHYFDPQPEAGMPPQGFPDRACCRPAAVCSDHTNCSAKPRTWRLLIRGPCLPALCRCTLHQQ